MLIIFVIQVFRYNKNQIVKMANNGQWIKKTKVKIILKKLSFQLENCTIVAIFILQRQYRFILFIKTHDYESWETETVTVELQKNFYNQIYYLAQNSAKTEYDS